MRKVLVSTAAALALAAFSGPASAAQIILNNLGGVEEGTAAYKGFSIAADFWSKRLTNNVTINLDVGFSVLGPGILGQAGSNTAVVPIELAKGQILALGDSQLDAIAGANLPVLNPGAYGYGALDVLTSGYKLPTGEGVNTATRVLDSDLGANNSFLNANSANLKALGFTGFGDAADGSIEFSNQYKFDFNPNDGIAADSIDFIGVAVHEIGHALGFVSGVDIYDLLGSPNGGLANDPTYALVNLNDYAVASVLDLFRYSSGPGGTVLDWSVGGNPFFSIDGQNPYQNGNFSTGSFNGDGRQASHWKDNASGLPSLGMMDPTVAYGQMGRVSSLDLAAFDAMGWNIDYGVLGSGRSFSTKEIYLAAVPEPSTWAMLITGFLLTGGALRRRRALAIA
ncbi:MAG: PEP-CTERM sorting domain-containing protein [Phenylobacterium sp.]|uniref:NF038122 family metalloprotease n=1 Tax=Phenylobacterium sp. TaxID=1871053 RepID=UPI0025CDF5FE|nr:NF038122 family metalloprotease [Phenylobacterium sp.]MBA4012475.1 PEP-CTERM sorting domain-containing protein [Phenylobacterium sp.]